MTWVRLLTSIGFLVLICPVAAQIRLADSAFQRPKVVANILYDVAFCFPNGSNLPPILVQNDPTGPRTNYRRNLNGEIIVVLNIEPRQYARLVYQFAHELIHIFAGLTPRPPELLWLEETLAETGSLFALRQLALRWQTKPPHPSLRGYHQHLFRYAQNIITLRKPIPSGELSGFLRKSRTRLIQRPLNRPLFSTIAVTLLPTFEKQPEKWNLLTKFPPDKRGAPDEQ